MGAVLAQVKMAFMLLALCIPAIVYADENSANNATTPIDAAPASTKDGITITVKGTINIFADKEKKIYVEFISSKKASDALRNALSAAGFRMAETRDEADVVYEVDGAYQALRPATQRTAEIRAGDFVEQSEPLKTRSGRGAKLVLGNPLVTIIGSIAENLASATGVRDALNSAASGDPDGKCLSDCEKWKYSQRSVINFKRVVKGEEQKMTAISETVADDLVPSKLFQGSLRGLTDAAGIKLDDILSGVFARSSPGNDRGKKGDVIS